MNISNFKKGDIITRVDPAHLKTSIGDIPNSQYIGDKVRFLGIANGCIYLERTSSAETFLRGQTFNIPHFMFCEGWAYYEEPKFMKGKGDSLSAISKAIDGPKIAALEKWKESALKEEDYKTVAKIDAKLRDLKNTENDEEIDLDNPEMLSKYMREIFNDNHPGKFDDFGFDDNID
ncbi:MAG: hypothetical protein HC831_08045 [Chloroflexia bacterium]|nr:hypothetical protein [Chloroflexia bacterium]